MNVKFVSAFSIFLAVGIGSCAAMNSSGPEKVDDWLKADYNQMKKRLILLERENSVLTDENEQYKRDYHAQIEKIEALDQDMEALKKKHQEDVGRLEGQVALLTEQNTNLEKESAKKIQELTRLNKEAELKYGNDMQRLNAQISVQREQFEQEQKAMRDESAQKQAACTQRTEELKKEIVSRDATITALQKTQGEQSEKLDETLRALDAKNKEIRRLQGEVNGSKGKPKGGGETTHKGSQGTDK